MARTISATQHLYSRHEREFAPATAPLEGDWAPVVRARGVKKDSTRKSFDSSHLDTLDDGKNKLSDTARERAHLLSAVLLPAARGGAMPSPTG